DALGITELVRELVACDLPDGAHEEATGLAETWFAVTGTATEVVAHLRAVCALLADLPLGRLTQVAGSLDPAERSSELDTVGVLLARRFGPHGPGLARWPATRYSRFSPDEV